MKSGEKSGVKSGVKSVMKNVVKIVMKNLKSFNTMLMKQKQIFQNF